MDAAGNYIGVPLLGLISPFTLLTGLLGLAMFPGAGAHEGDIRADAVGGGHHQVREHGAGQERRQAEGADALG